MQLSPQVIYENERYTKSSPSQPDSVPSSGSGVAILASSRAQLLLMKRRVVEALAEVKGWQSGWASLKATPLLTDVNLDEDQGAENDQKDATENLPKAEPKELNLTLLSAPLVAAIASVEDFRAVYEVLFHRLEIVVQCANPHAAIEQSCSVTLQRSEAH